MLLNKLKQSVNEKFINAKVSGTGEKAPRPGYYFIRSLSYQTVEPFGEICIGNVNWKQNVDDLFVEDLVFPIALSNLSSAKPEETADFKTEEDLIGKVVYIFNPRIVQRNFNGEEKNVLSCLWQLVDETPNFITEDNVFLHSLSKEKQPEAVSIVEALTSLKESSSYDVSATEENEAVYGNKTLVYVEDAAWLDDDFTEDPNNSYDPWDDNNEASDESDNIAN
jgi:hypothetical protein